MRSGAIIGWALAALSLIGCDPATDPLSYDDFVLQEGEGEFGAWVQAGYYSRTYYLHTPPNISDGEDHPLLIVLHGAGGTGEVFHRVLRADGLTDAAGFVTVYPDGMEHTWTVGCEDCTFAEALKADDVNFLEILVRHLAENLPIDTLRVHVVGFSQGGSLAHLFACQSSLPIAGMATVASLVYRRVEMDCSPAGAFPVVIIHGTGDLMAYYEGYGIEAPLLSVPEAVEMWVEQLSCNPSPTVTELPDTAGDYSTVTSFRFDGCASGGGVLHHRVNNGGHNWPGDTGPWGYLTGLHSHNLDATKEILDFWALVQSGG